VGPSLGGIGSRAAERLADPGYDGSARSAEDYLRESIVAPSAFVVPGGVFATPEGASFMPDTMAKTLSPGQVDELVAYLASLR
jgi:nitric oxide reductase subunit C